MQERSVNVPDEEAEGGSGLGGAGLRLLALAAGLVVAALAWHTYAAGRSWWWTAGLLLAVAMGVVALPRPAANESDARRRRRRVAGVATLAATAVFFSLWSRPGRELPAFVFATLALASFFAARWRPMAARRVRDLIGPDREEPRPRIPVLLLRTAGALAAITAGVGAAWLNQDNDHLAAFLVWIASLTLFALAFWRRPPRDPEEPSWCHDGGPPLSTRATWAALVAVLAIAAALRVTALDRFPVRIEPDEGRQGRQAERIWSDGFPDAFGIGWNSFPHLSYMVEYTGVQARGTSNASLRLSAAAIGVLSLIPVFFWTRRWWGNAIALLAIALLAVNREHVYWSRIALNNIHQVLVAGLMLAAFARVLWTRRAVDWVWFGYSVGLGFHTYHAVKLYPALIATAALLLAVAIRRFLRRFAAGAAVGALAFTLSVGPLWVTMAERWEQFYNDTSNRVDLDKLTGAWWSGDVEAVRAYVSSHVGGCLRAFVPSPTQRDAFLDPFVFVPFVVGLGWMLWTWRDPRHVVVLVWIGGILVIGGMITSYPPWKARMIGFLPAVLLVPAVLAGHVRRILYGLMGARADVLIAPALALWIGLSAHYGWQTEFVQRAAAEGADEMSAICRAIEAMPLPGTLYMLGADVMREPRIAAHDCMIGPRPDPHARFGSGRPDRHFVTVAAPSSVVPLPPDHHGAAVILLREPQGELASLVRHVYPDARMEIVHDRYGNAMLTTFTLSAAEVERHRAFTATLTGATGRRHVTTMPRLQVAGEGVAFPVRARWEGLLHVDGADVRHRARGGRLRIGVQDNALDDVTGWRPAIVTAELAGSGDVVFLERRGTDGTWTPLPPAAMHVHSGSGGLRARYFAGIRDFTEGAPIGAEPAAEHLESALALDWYSPFGESAPPPHGMQPATMEWSGTVVFDTTAPRVLRLESTLPVSLFVDGDLSLKTEAAPDGREIVLDDRDTRATLLVRARREANAPPARWWLRLLWRTAAGGWTASAHYVPFYPTPTPVVTATMTPTPSTMPTEAPTTPRAPSSAPRSTPTAAGRPAASPGH